MEKVEIKFLVNNEEKTIQCTRSELIKDIIKQLNFKVKKGEQIFFYNGKKLIIEDNQTLGEINHKDNKVSILVLPSNFKSKNVFKDIICPECYEPAFLNFNDYKLSLTGCSNGHEFNNLLIKEFLETQQTDTLPPTCNICNNKNLKKNNNKFFICSCGNLLCSICNKNHQNTQHKTINFDKKIFYCKLHGEEYIAYCKKCYKNLCFSCINEHSKMHSAISYFFDESQITEQINQIKHDLNEFKEKIDIINEEILKQIILLQKLLDYFNSYYSFINDIINKSGSNITNYQMLTNIKNINNNISKNSNIVKDLNKIINEKNNKIKISYLAEIYEKIKKGTEEYYIEIFNNKYNTKLNGKEAKLNLINDSEKNKTINKPFKEIGDDGLFLLSKMKLRYLQELLLWKNNIKDISHLIGARFTRLKALGLKNNNISEIKPLVEMKFNQLIFLDLSYNNIINIKKLEKAKFNGLLKLYLNNNKISDINVLNDVNFFKLELLSLHDNNISDIKILEKVIMPYLLTLHLGSNKIRDLTPLKKSNFKNLQKLNLIGNKISDISIFKNVQFVKLEELYLAENSIIDISVFERTNFLQLKKLFLHKNKIRDIDCLNNANLPQLEILTLNDNQILKFEIRTIKIKLNNLKNLFIISELTNELNSSNK